MSRILRSRLSIKAWWIQTLCPRENVLVTKCSMILKRVSCLIGLRMQLLWLQGPNAASVSSRSKRALKMLATACNTCLRHARQHAVEDAPQASNSATAVGDAAPAPASPPASSSSSSSSTDSSTSGSDDDSNSSSSSSSSSSGSGCAASVDAARGPDAPDEREPRRRTADRVVEWGILRLTPKVAADGTTFAWQMTCRHPGHVPCNRTRNVASCASEDECLRMLKQWALFGVECTSKGDHKLAWSRVEAMSKDGSLPSTAALDVQAITDIALYR